MESRLLILGLHRIGVPPAEAKIRGLFMTPSLLRFQLGLLRRLGFRFLTLREAMADPQGRRAVITFDDGYYDNIANALPVLNEFAAPATLFAITGDVGRKSVVWDEAGEKLPADMLDWSEIRALQDQGWEIGSHAHRHIHLARYTRGEQDEVIGRSITEIQENLGETPVSFAYPYGSYDEVTKASLRHHGIRYAVTTRSANASDVDAGTDLLEMSRVSLGGRRFYHYAKAFLKTKNAIGVPAMLSGFSSAAPMSRIEFPVSQPAELGIFRRSASSAGRSSS